MNEKVGSNDVSGGHRVRVSLQRRDSRASSVASQKSNHRPLERRSRRANTHDSTSPEQHRRPSVQLPSRRAYRSSATHDTLEDYRHSTATNSSNDTPSSVLNRSIRRSHVKKSEAVASRRDSLTDSAPSSDCATPRRSKFSRFKSRSLTSIVGDEIEVSSDVETDDVDTVLQHISESGHLSICDLPALLPILRSIRLFAEANEISTQHAMKYCRVVASPAMTLIWCWTGLDQRIRPDIALQEEGIEHKHDHGNVHTGVCLPSDIKGNFLMLSGRVCMISCHGEDTTKRELSKGQCGDTSESGVVGIWTLEDSTILWMPKERICEHLTDFSIEVLIEKLRSRPQAKWSDEEMDVLSDLCAVYPFFEDHDHCILRKIVAIMKYRHSLKGELLARQGEVPDTLFIVLSGSVRPFRKADEVWEGITRFRKHGMIVNDFVLFERVRSDCNMRCVTSCDLLSLNRADYEKVMGVEELERQRMIYTLRNVPPTHPGELPQRSDEQLALLCKFVEATPEFSNLPRATLLQAMGAAVYLSTPGEHVLFREGDVGDKFYAIIEGKVSVNGKFRNTITSESAEDSKALASNAGCTYSSQKAVASSNYESQRAPISKRIDLDEATSSIVTLCNSFEHEDSDNRRAENVLKCLEARAKDKSDLGRVITHLATGETFGAKTLLQHEARTASVATVVPTKFLVVSRDDFLAVMKVRLEADIKDRLDFLCSHLPGLRETQANISRNEMHRLERAANLMNKETFPRGKLLIREGDLSGQNLYFLRSGTVAVYAPRGGSSKLLPVAKPQSVAAMVSEPGQLFGSSAPILQLPEPASVKIESASCDAFSLSWNGVWRFLPQRVVDALRRSTVDMHARRSALSTPREHSVMRCRDPKDDSNVHAAWSDFGDASKCYSDVPPPHDALPHEILLHAAKTKILQSHLQSRALAVPPTDAQHCSHHSHRALSLSTNTAAHSVEFGMLYQLGVDKALQRVCAATQNTGTGCRPRPTPPPKKLEILAPPDFCVERLQAELLEVLHKDPSEVVQNMFSRAVTDPNKGDLDAWIKRYMFDPRVSGNRQIRDILRKFRIGTSNGSRHTRASTQVSTPRAKGRPLSARQ